MRLLVRGIATLATAVALAACSGSGAATGGPAATSGGAATQAAVCEDSTGTTTVEATVVDFAWSQPINAKVGDVITWTNNDSAAHKVGTDDGSCTMGANIAGSGGKASLVFNKAGTYPFHCTIHSNMKGTITIS
ncbi:MAG TPA: plastocyanin/azurin family copper-binding protein [Candidatus Limnocylindrales bacterium]|nr:plastocyanin/azurin family copper-binding protein [Candidatus Limnocylindrales bacterium]